jgi:hypothetical protein
VDSSPNVPKGDPSLPAATYGFSVAADGELKPIPGFPASSELASFWAASNLVSGKYVFAGNPDGLHIDTFGIGADGTLSKVQSTAIPVSSGCGGCNSGGPALADQSGTSLYAYYNGPSGQLYYQVFKIDQSSGALTYESVVGPATGPGGGFRLATFSGDDQYVYASASHLALFDGRCIDYIAQFSRNADGSLSNSPQVAVAGGPAAPPGHYYGEQPLAADGNNHLAAIITNCDSKGTIIPPQMLVSFTINANGNLTSTSTSADLPTPAGGMIYTGALSPSGTLLAVAGTTGVQLFNFNGAAPMTAATGLIAVDGPQQLAWDNYGHLFVLSVSKLYIFNATDKGLVQAAGSPHSIPNAANMFVEP